MHAPEQRGGRARAAQHECAVSPEIDRARAQQKLQALIQTQTNDHVADERPKTLEPAGRYDATVVAKCPAPNEQPFGPRHGRLDSAGELSKRDKLLRSEF